MRKIVFDIETSNTFFDVGKNDPALLDMSIICIWDSETDAYSSYLVHELPKLWPVIERADLLIGFNSDHFDIPVLNKYYPGDLLQIKSIDLLAEVRKSLGRRIGLGALAKATLKVGKSGNGLEAISWWKTGQIEKLRKYCLDDVKITKDLYEYMVKNKCCYYEDGSALMKISIDPSQWETLIPRALTQTLPF
ncbi:MAG: hypothetical protein A2928_03955 [Candidatus Taylorbacteria bacterium RIFCSPLOWO2_01_FULL_45_15b]|uniref:YprB ribonuclease H-like domain-containing protein n=1 Tax=Candidatus Taylorbacteria bacterium RIFCSPLOWO2_01_FULL_45_15b TaxID=1802319 RepID=A0A1G2NG30_9BACT|nr:MAG: hypothetical protein A2928_03955 [Candidatus Taylorbacteria bacterium RIFCSPLOWO2_01_FULL_45_15b]